MPCYHFHMKDVKKILRSFLYAVRGLRHAYKSDKSFRMEIQYGLPIYLVVVLYAYPLLTWEIILLTLSYMLILIVELVNTAFEKMLDKIHPEQHEMIGQSKDIAAAAVFIAFLFALIVVSVLLATRLMDGTGSVLIQHTFV